jgi:uncharacterized protein
MTMKLLLLLVVLGVGLAWFTRGRRKPPPPAGDAAARRAPVPQAMVSCAHCGLHLPAADALPGPEGHHFCSDAHRRAGPRRAG